MSRLVLLAAVVALIGAPTASHAEESPCAPFDKLALAELPTRLDPDSPDRLQDIWVNWSTSSDAEHWPFTTGDEPQFRIETAEGFVPHPHAYEVRGVRTKGIWRLQARSKAIKHRADRWGRWRQVSVTADTASALNRIVEGRCLWSAPSFLPSTLPLAAGGWVPSLDGPLTWFDVRGFGQRWAGLQVSWTLGAPAELRWTVLAASFGASIPPMPLESTGIRYRDERGEHLWGEQE